MPPEPVRVGFLLPHFRPGGAERVVLNWIGALDRSRFQPVLFLGTVDGAFLAELPADVEPIAIGRGRALLRPWRIARLLKAHRIGIAYSATNAMNLALLRAPTRSVRKIVSEHTMPGAYLATAKWRRFRQWQMRTLYPRADAVAVPTDAIGAALQTVIARPLALHTLPNPVVKGSNGDNAEHAATGHIVSAGRLVPEKGYDILIDAFARVHAEHPAATLTIYGDGPLRADLQARIDRRGLARRVTLAGHVADLGPPLAQADLFVLASRREGFGNVLVEAMAAGTPVIATRCGGPDSFIRHGDNGWLVPSEDPQALAAQIADLLGDPARLRSTVASARRTACDYDIAGSTKSLESLLLSLAANRA